LSAVELTKRDNVSFSWIEMSMRVSLWSYIVSTAFVIGTTASAQSSNYHLEYVRNGETTDIVLVNDSSKAIDAYSLVQRCPLTQGSLGDDVLDSPENSVEIRFTDGRTAQSRSAEPGGRWFIYFFLNSDKSKYVGECALRAEFILFGDGSYEGKESQARSMKTKRDGMFASIIEWLEILNRHSADELDVIDLRKIAGQREDEDRQKALKYCKPGQSDCGESATLSYEFWAGKWKVDANINGCLIVSKMSGQDWCENDPGSVFQNVKDFLESWKSKFDADPAMKRLREEFPPSVPDKPVDERDPL
jgi:hypothetical protein